MIAAPRAATNLWPKTEVLRRQIFIRTRSNLVLNAAANMQGRDAAAQIFKLDTLKSCCTHHASKFFLIRKLQNRIRQIFIGISRTAKPATDPGKQSRVIKSDKLPDT